MADSRMPVDRQPFVETSISREGNPARIATVYCMEPDRTQMSTIFEEDRQRLSLTHRDRLDLMRQMFFQPRVGTHSGTAGDLHLPTSRFDCAIGTIWYHYSPEMRCLVMSCFVLHGGAGGGGGGSVVFHAKFMSTCLRSANDDNPVDWSDDIAARLRTQFARLGNAFKKTFEARRGSLFGRISLSASHYCFDWSVKDRAPSDRLLVEIASTCQSFSDRNTALVLPAWSMLRETTVVAEQLENSFARAIFLGEALCKISFSFDMSDHHSRFTKMCAHSADSFLTYEADDTRLYKESRVILNAVRLGVFDRERMSFRHYLMASLLERDVLGDVRRLWLVHNEMIYRLAMALARSQSAHRRDDEFRFARLAEFAHLSGDFFGIADCNGVASSILDEITIHQRGAGSAVRQAVSDLSDYGESAMVIVNKLPIDLGRKGKDTHEPFKRLCQLVADILSYDERTVSEP